MDASWFASWFAHAMAAQVVGLLWGLPVAAACVFVLTLYRRIREWD